MTKLWCKYSNYAQRWYVCEHHVDTGAIHHTIYYLTSEEAYADLRNRLGAR